MQEDINEIIPYLYISNWYTSNNIDIIKQFNIKAVITVETRQKPKHIIDFYKLNNIDFMYINIEDNSNANISKYFDITYDFINKHLLNNHNVLVHCYAGISRSSTIVINYLLRYLYENNNISCCPCEVLKNVILYAQNKRPIIYPNSGFINQLTDKSIYYDIVF